MKYLKRLSIFTFALAISISFLTPSNAQEAFFISGPPSIGGGDPPLKKIREDHCVDDDGELTGIGNSCIRGFGNCKANKCS